MGLTSVCVLGLFLLNILLYCGHAQDVLLSVEPNWSTFFTGENVTFICDTREGVKTDWYYSFRRDGQTFTPFSTYERNTSAPLTPEDSGEYQCVAAHKISTHVRRESNNISLTVSDKDVILETPASSLLEGESVTLHCRHRNQSKEKNADFYKDGSLIEKDRSHQTTDYTTFSVTSDGSSYTCKFEDEESEPIKLKIEPRPKAQLSKDFPVWRRVTLTCSVRSSSSSSSSSGWKYFWYRGKKTSEPLNTQDDVLMSNGQISVSQEGGGGGVYWCRGGRGDPLYYTEYSDPVVTNRAVLTLQPDWPEIYFGETITLTCGIKDGGDAEWEYEWVTPTSHLTPQNLSGSMMRPSDSGNYFCKGRLKDETSSTEWSNSFTMEPNERRPVLTVSPLWLSPGDSVTLTCSVEHPSAGWRFFWYQLVPKLSDSYSSELLPGSTNGTEQDSYIVHGQTHTAGYVCRAGRGDPVFYTHYSKPKFVWSGDSHSAASLTVSPDRVQYFNKVPLSLSCEGNSTEWRVSRLINFDHLSYCSFWGTMTRSTCMDRIWFDGVYWCESESGEFSNAANITIQYGDVLLVSSVHPVTEGHSVTLGCKLKTEKVLYNVEFYKNDKLISNQTSGELFISEVTKSDEGLYKCKGTKSPRGSRSLTSPESWLSVKYKPQAVLTVSPLWLSPGDSVTLTCSVEHPSAGWRFFWYQLIPKLSDSYSSELLPGSTNGTEQDSYIVHGQTHTAGYVCRAGRGDPVFYTQYSEHKFVWSGDSHSAASLTVSPDRVQYFSKESLSVSCEGNSTEWRVSRLINFDYLSYCSFWGTMNGSTCMDRYWLNGVYWCESESGEFSNAANITLQHGDVLLVSSVHPVTEGHSVTLGCKLKSEKVLYNVEFYKNDKLISNQTSGELFISEVTKSDEGLYKCKGTRSPQGSRSLTSPESWLSVKCEND